VVAVRDDTRGRVPFALLGVLLLVSSLSLAPTLVTDPVPDDTAVERVLDRTTAETQTAVRDGVASAGRRAASDPVITPADTTVGNALNETTPFRDSLRLRVYLRVRERLSRVSDSSGAVTATAHLPPADDEAEVRRAIGRVHVERAGPNRTALRATVENVTLTVRRGDRTVTVRRVSPTVVVPTPVLALHDQVTTYERRVNSGLGKPGLSQRLTARLYPMAWARGYAQYGGAPISNVVANRHVALATNGALLGVQRSTFGRSDPDGRRALTEATAMTGLEDVVRGADGTELASRVLDRANYRPAREEISAIDRREQRPGPGDAMQVGVNETAVRAFRDVAAPARLNRTLRDAYSVEVRLVANVDRVRGGPPPRPSSPGPNWTLIDEETTRQSAAVGAVDGDVGPPAGWHTLDSFGRVVEREYTRAAIWERGSEQRTTATTGTERWRVTVAVVGRHDGGSPAPVRPIRTAHERGRGPLSGPNLASVEPRAERRLVRNAGGADVVAQRAVRGELDTEPVTVRGERPAGLRAWVYRDLMALRERIRSTAVSVERGSVGAFAVNPARRLRTRLAERRAELADVPARYGTTAQKARAAARIAYLNAVEARLAEQASGRDSAGDALGEALERQTGGSLADLRRSLTARETRVPSVRPTPTGPAGPVRTRVDASPQYLTRSELDESRYPALDGSEHPLVTRNVNVFTVPYGDAAAAVTGGLVESDRRVRLGTAGRTLRSANRTTRVASDRTLEERRDRLQSTVTRSNRDVTGSLAATLRSETSADRRQSRAIVTEAITAWPTTAGRAQALSNGSAVDRIVTVTASRQSLSATERDWLRVQLGGTLERALERPESRPRSSVVSRTADAVRDVACAEATRHLGEAGRRGAEDLAERRLGISTLPAGLPLAPPVAPWYATANVWWVTVEGEYARFAVSARHGAPTTPGAQTTYARDGDPVTIDVDDDGDRERLGTATRISFRAETGIVVVVPPRPRGVGDKDGVAVETSSGWPTAGP
jgi:hypothetical protein